MSTRNFVASVKHAIQGILYVLVHENNFRIQVIASILVLMLGSVLALSTSERIVLVLLVIFILVLELVNSAIEKFMDIVKPRLHIQVKTIKDIMAGTVLIASIGAIAIGAMIFFPHLIEIWPH